MNYDDHSPDRDAVAEASRVIKDHAARQKIELEVGDEAFTAMLAAWRKLNPQAPAEISFVREGKEVGNFKVASCAYWSDTCCA
ncbi:MAG TPA: hypothetical protein VF062_11045 [Candidatus Limnocylindrales bacterium]